jgi:pilus assembly protein Flp/PilA
MTKLFVTLQALVSGLRSNEKGATAVEYGLIVALIALAIIVAVALVGTNLNTLFHTVATSV